MSEFLKHLRYVLTENPVTLIAGTMFVLLIVAAIIGPAIVPYDPMASSASQSLKAPSWEHWFGTDQLGRDVFSRIVVATRLDLSIAVSAVAISFVFGSILGSLAGFFGGWVDRIVGRITDTIMAFPLFVLAMGIVAALGNSVENIVYATAIINLPFYARVSRTEVNIRRSSDFVLAARLAGNSSLRLLATHIYPNTLPPLMVQVSLNMGWAILNAAGLSFIGLGVRPPTAEWGIMVAEGAGYIVSGEWWLAIFPGLALMLAVFTFNLLGDGLRDLIDPRRRT
ncbi:ABC transporter permease [Sneathiella litorea]|uniref:ABC transporter permease subunit n=1 Tax=Sneathiella litorea TaxID=2606216 RepID=A0A6L8WD65_9PROT|nr:ABC transporter permease [Sneathiella litorea]MZR32380.1 ABC transporter permease subunit [Sneathiella litorea]